MRAGRLVRFTRPFEPGMVDGYVRGVGRELFLIALVSDQIHFDGFQAYRICDIRGLRDHPYATFIERALGKRHERRPRAPRIGLGSLRQLLLSAAAAFPLVTIHREEVAPDVCHIGRIVKVANGRLGMLEIGPNADWDEEPREYSLKELTKVEFGGAYEDALHIVGGDPPAKSLRTKANRR